MKTVKKLLKDIDETEHERICGAMSWEECETVCPFNTADGGCMWEFRFGCGDRTLEIPLKKWKMMKKELERAKRGRPDWPTDPIHAAGIVAEEAGELVRAAQRVTYEGKPMSELLEEAIQTGAMAARFIENYGRYITNKTMEKEEK